MTDNIRATHQDSLSEQVSPCGRRQQIGYVRIQSKESREVGRGEIANTGGVGEILPCRQG